MGIITAIGHHVAENRQSLILGNSGISNLCNNINSKYVDDFPSGFINISNDELIDKIKIQRKDISRTTLLAQEACLAGH